ncbi:hypothetical protein MRX96_014295 [Rhipicephalus microplus]
MTTMKRSLFSQPRCSASTKARDGAEPPSTAKSAIATLPFGYFQDDDDEAVPLLSATLFRFYQGRGTAPSCLRLPSLP